MATTVRPDPWDRREGESNPAWAAFQRYRDMGPERSIAKVAQEVGKNKTLLTQWSAKHSWVVRCSAFDAWEDQQRLNARKVAIRRAEERNIRVANAAMTVVGNAVMALGQDDKRTKAMSANDISRLMEVASKLERVTLGQTTDNVALVGGGQKASTEHVPMLSDEDRRIRMLQLRRELDTRLGGEDEEAS